ncbi:mRNA interferase PemK [Spirochaetia bacterium]|nr:mRNA interferase PemK [Spirochaetia bacterium]
MGRFMKGDVVVVPFPFSDLRGTKRRPAFVLADLDGDDIILCQITSQSRTDRYAIPLETGDFISSNLSTLSVVRPNRVFTADKNMILYSVGTLNAKKIKEIIDGFISIIL